ncbi:hypothetical protein ACJX0J_028357, partial [Zea mays]
IMLIWDATFSVLMPIQNIEDITDLLSKYPNFILTWNQMNLQFFKLPSNILLSITFDRFAQFPKFLKICIAALCLVWTACILQEVLPYNSLRGANICHTNVFCVSKLEKKHSSVHIGNTAIFLQIRMPFLLQKN